MSAKHTPGPWRVRRQENPTYPDLPTFDVLAPNPDAGKQGVPYSGEEFMVVADVDCEEDARLIAKAPQMAELLRDITSYFHQVGEEIDAIEQARALLTEIDGDPHAQ